MKFISENNLAALLGTSNATVQRWSASKIYPSYTQNGIKGFNIEDLNNIPEIKDMLNSVWEEESDVKPLRNFTSIELFAGAGGLALGLSKAGFKHVLLNEFNHSACQTLSLNQPEWNVIEGDIHNVDFTPLRGKVDFLSGGFPCQAFSYAGKQGGFNDTRGTLFFELARAVKEIQPKVFLGENVKGLLSHDGGRTLQTIRNVISELGYTLIEPRVLKAIMYKVPQKRERLILIAIRNDIAGEVIFHWPSPYTRVLTLRDAFYPGVIYDTDVPTSIGVKYPPKKQNVLSLVPQGGDWRDLPEAVAKEYMGGSWLLGGGKTGMARRLSLDEPSLTLTCSPCQKQTERCHPIETRPLSVREYARIQTFPDNWLFYGTIADQYKQIGNAVPVNLAWALGRSVMRLFNEIQTLHPEEAHDCQSSVESIMELHRIRKAQREATEKQNRIDEKNRRNGQLNIFDLLNQYEDGIIRVAKESVSEYLENTDNILIGVVKKDNQKDFLDNAATLYYSGKQFPTTIDLQKIAFFIPYISGKGIKNIYRVTKIRVGTYREGQPEADLNDYRLVFELQYVTQFSTEYKAHNLEIWHTFSTKSLNQLGISLDEKV